MTDYDFLISEGVAAGHINDMWLAYLGGTGQFNDEMFAWLGDLGYTGDLTDRYNAWVLNGRWVPHPSTTATAGTPGSFNHDVPADLATLNALGALGNTVAWVAGEWVVLGDASEAYWDGSVWVSGKVP